MIDFAHRLSRFGSQKFATLRDGQYLVLEEYAANHLQTPDLAIEMATGEGKTLVALMIADYALDNGHSVAYLAGTRQLAQHVLTEANTLDLEAVLFSGGNYGAHSLYKYHEAYALGIMNYWVYFNASPKLEPADLLILDDAHLAEQAISGMYTLCIPRHSDGSLQLYESICDLILSHTDRYQNLRAMRDGNAEPGTAPELLSFNDWSSLVGNAEEIILSSPLVSYPPGLFPWRQIRGRLSRCAILIGPSAIEIGPYYPPTQLNNWYSHTKQRLYLSATLGSMEDLQRRIGGFAITKLATQSSLPDSSTGTRDLVLNPTTLPSSDSQILDWVLRQVSYANGRAAWLCSSNAEADTIEDYLHTAGYIVFRLRAGNDDVITRWRLAQQGHLVTAGRYDGLDLAGDLCRLVVIPTVPRASTEFERFVVAYLGDASFIRNRIGQRITQAIGRANRVPTDRVMYVGLDPSFGEILANRSVREYISRSAESTVQDALVLHEQGMQATEEACIAFWSGQGIHDSSRIDQRRQRPGRSGISRSSITSAADEVRASTDLWLGSADAAGAARRAAETLDTVGETEHGAFWRYVEAHSHYVQGSLQGRRRARRALEEAVRNGPRTVWFRRLESTAAALAGRVSVSSELDSLFQSWDEWIRERGNRIRHHLEGTRSLLSGTHDEQCQALTDMGRLFGVTTQRPPKQEQSAPDCRWKWLSRRGVEVRVWEVKTSGRQSVPRADINQVLGQIEADRTHITNSRVFGCLITQAFDIEGDALRAARDKVTILHHGGMVKLFELLRVQMLQYMDYWDDDSAESRGRARVAVEAALPRVGWLTNLLVPSSGKVLSAHDVALLFDSQ